MKKITLIALFAVLAHAQPELKYKGFNGEFAQFGSRKGSGREFILKVDNAPYHFTVSGVIDAGVMTNDLDIMLDDVVAVVSYFDQGYSAGGTPVVTGFSQVQFFAEDEPCKVSDVKFELLPPLDKDKQALALFAAVPGLQKEYQSVADPAAEAAAVTLASADPWSKSYMEAEARDAAKKLAEQQAAEEKRLAAEQAQADKAAKAALAAQQKADKKAERERQAAERQALRAQKAEASSGEPSTPVRAESKSKAQPASSGSISERIQNMETIQKIGLTSIGVGTLTAIYGILQHMEFGKKNTALSELERDLLFQSAPQVYRSWKTRPLFDIYGNILGPDNVTPWHAGQPGKSFDDIEREKLSHASNRNLGLLLGAVLIGSGIVMINF